MAVHKPGSIWPLRSGVTDVNVRTLNADALALTLPTDPTWMHLTEVEMSRKDARLLAKRINACLDATTTKGA